MDVEYRLKGTQAWLLLARDVAEMVSLQGLPLNTVYELRLVPSRRRRPAALIAP